MKIPKKVLTARARIHELYSETQTLTRSRHGSNLSNKVYIDSKLAPLEEERHECEKVLREFLDGRYSRILSGLAGEKIAAQRTKESAMASLIDSDAALTSIAEREMEAWGEFRTFHRDAGMPAPAKPRKDVASFKGQRQTYGGTRIAPARVEADA